jgi:hypothetical protein
MPGNPTLTAVARRAGVSQATACRALNPNYQHQVRPATRQLVETAARQLGYRRCRAEHLRRDPIVTLPAPPVAYLALSASRPNRSLRGAALRPDRKQARGDADHRNRLAAANGTVGDWTVYAIVPTTRIEETTADASRSQDEYDPTPKCQ